MAMSLALKYLPEHQFEERHDIMVRSSPAAILDAVGRMEPSNDAVIGTLLALRQLPHRIGGGRGKVTEAFGLKNFTLLERSDQELVYGLVGRFWRLDFGLRTIRDGEAFRAFAEPGVAKLVMTFETQPLDGTRTRLVARTLVQGADRAARWPLTAYWAAIRPASGFIRRRMLHLVRRVAEAAPAAP